MSDFPFGFSGVFYNSLWEVSSVRKGGGSSSLKIKKLQSWQNIHWFKDSVWWIFFLKLCIVCWRNDYNLLFQTWKGKGEIISIFNKKLLYLHPRVSYMKMDIISPFSEKPFNLLPQGSRYLLKAIIGRNASPSGLLWSTEWNETKQNQAQPNETKTISKLNFFKIDWNSKFIISYVSLTIISHPSFVLCLRFCFKGGGG